MIILIVSILVLTFRELYPLEAKFADVLRPIRLCFRSEMLNLLQNHDKFHWENK